MTTTIGVTPQNINFVPTEPRFKDVLDYFGKQLKSNFNCHHIATIDAFNPTTQTATVSINYKQTYLQVVEGVQSIALNSYRPLEEVPVIVLKGGDARLTFPISVGDQCLLLFNDRDIDNWFTSGSTTTPPNTGRLHSFADAIALVGLNSLVSSIDDYDSVRALLQNGSAKLGVGAGDGTLCLIANDSYTLGGLLTSLTTQLGNLTTQLQNLTTAIELITVTCATPGNPSSVPINVASFVIIGAAIGTIATAISTVQTDLGLLLE